MANVDVISTSATADEPEEDVATVLGNRQSLGVSRVSAA